MERRKEGVCPARVTPGAFLSSLPVGLPSRATQTIGNVVLAGSRAGSKGTQGQAGHLPAPPAPRPLGMGISGFL